MNRLKIVVILSFVFLLASCGGTKKTTSGKTVKTSSKSAKEFSSKSDKETPSIEDLPNPLERNIPHFESDVSKYIFMYKDVAMEEMGTYGIPASITIGQGILESQSGKSELVRKSNNHFGIKCHEWEGEKVYHDDDLRQECFRKYENPNYSFRDHSLFLTDRPRYSKLFDLPIDDYKSWAKGLKAAGYATDPSYPKKLIGIIERYELYKYDEEVLNKADKNIEVENKPKPEEELAQGDTKSAKDEVYIVQKGDTLYSISKKFDLTVDELKSKNKLDDNGISIGQVLDIGN